MYKLVIALLLTLGWCCTTHCTRTVSSHLGPSDLTRLQSAFVDGLTSDDLQAIFFSTLNIEVTKAEERKQLCKKIVQLHEDSNLIDFEKDYYLIGAHKNVHCTDKLSEKLLSKVYASLKAEPTSSQELFYRVTTHKLLGVQVDDATRTKLIKALRELLKKDDSVTSLGYGFNVAADLGRDASFVADRIEDAIVQADEVDGKLLQFEGGLSITAMVINGAFRLTQTLNTSPPMTSEQAVKFATYFLSRRSVQSPKGAHVLIEALKSLSSSGKIAPVCIQVIGNAQIHAASPSLTIAIVDLLGKALTTVPQNVIGKILGKKDNVVLAEKVQLTAKSSDKTTFIADLSAYKPTRGLYLAEVNADNVFKQSLTFKVLGRVKVHSFEVGIAESDASVAVKKQTLNYPNKLADVLTLDHTQKLSLKTVLIDEATTKVLTVHQAFVRFYNKNTEQEIIFVAEQDSNKAYKFELDVGTYAGAFRHKSGAYEVNLIVGDNSISNSFQWHVADVQLKFQEDVKEAKKTHARGQLPEITHQFRTPEQRPPRFVSDVFTGLCLTPLVLLFIFWAKLGINISNFSASPSTLGFHLGFGAILGLFAVFWLTLDMFQTLRFLIPIAIFTFLCGNRLLRRLFAQRASKSPAGAASS